MRTLVLLGLVACGDTKVEVETPDDTGDGIEDVGDGDTADSGDTAEPVGTPLTFVLDEQVDGAVLSLTWSDLSDGFVVGDTVATAPIDGTTIVLHVPDPTGDQLLELDPAAYPGTYVAWYLPAVHDDADGDGAHGADETYLAHGTVLPLYVGGTLPDDLAAWGLVAGWNALELGAQGATGIHDVDAIPLAVNLRPRETFTLAGDLADIETADDLRLTLVPGAVDQGVSPDRWLYDEALDGAWTIDVSGAPPEDHYANDGGSGLAATYEIPASYWDYDGSGGISAGDETAWAACFGDAAAALVWVAPPTTLEGAFAATVYGLGAGWSAMAWWPDDTSAILDDADAQALEIGSGNCTLD